MNDQFQTLELKLVVKVKNHNVKWMEEAIRMGLENGEDILEFAHVDNLPTPIELTED